MPDAMGLVLWCHLSSPDAPPADSSPSSHTTSQLKNVHSYPLLKSSSSLEPLQLLSPGPHLTSKNFPSHRLKLNQTFYSIHRLLPLGLHSLFSFSVKAASFFLALPTSAYLFLHPSRFTSNAASSINLS